jgi:hypothetical protein
MFDTASASNGVKLALSENVDAPSDLHRQDGTG